MNYTIAMFLQFMRRDVSIFHRRIQSYLINYGVLYPIMYAACFGYLVPHVTGQVDQTTVLFVGCVGLLIQILAFVMNIDLIFDLEQDRFTEYQASILPAPLVLIERLLFSSLFCFVFLIPFYPLSMVLLRGFVDFSHTCWPLLFFHLFLSSLFMCSLNILGLCFIKDSSSIDNLWLRCFHPMFMLGGFQVPRLAMVKVSPIFEYISLINPMTYVTEGLRSIIIGGPEFIDYKYCFLFVIISTIICTFVALHFFKKKLDHI